MAGGEKNRNRRETHARAEGSARTRRPPAKATPAGSAGAGVAVAWLVVVLAVLVVGGTYMIVHSAGTINRLSGQVTALESRAQEAQRKELMVAADYAEQAARYATQENYGLKDEAAANAERMAGLAMLLAEEGEASMLQAALDRLGKARLSRAPEVSSQLEQIAAELRALAPEGTAAAGPTPEKALPQPPQGRTRPPGQ